MAVLIEGDTLEGGGQVLRIAVSMSVLTETPIFVNAIRAGRKKPGLAAQHLNGVQLVKQISSGTLEGAVLGSKTLVFSPGTIKSGEYTADTKTAGSVALLLQVALPCCLFGDQISHLTLKGGTNADMAPQIEYTTRVFVPILKMFGADLEYEIKRRGFFPAGQGEVTFRIPAVHEIKPVKLMDFGEIEEITGEAYVAGKIPAKVADEMAVSAQNVLRPLMKTPVVIRVTKLSEKDAFGTGWGINLVAKTTTGCILGASQLGRSGLIGENVGRLAAEELTEAIERRVCVDQHLQDQLIIFMALAAGTSAMRIGSLTLHTETAINIVSKLCRAQFRIKKQRTSCIVECDGIGLKNKLLP